MTRNNETQLLSAQEPVVEPAPEGETAELPPEQELQSRIHQQEILAKLGVCALKPIPFDELADEIVQGAADGLQAHCCKLTQYIPWEDRLLVRAGVGWCAGTIGVATLPADLSSPSGFAFRTGKPVISNHLEQEERFSTPDLLARHSIRRAVNVIVQGQGVRYGVLEVDSTEPGKFTDRDITFLQGAANILGMALERQHREQVLNDALERQKLLIKEIDHRVKNSLQLVASMLSLQAVDDAACGERLQEASKRITAIARAHDRLQQTENIKEIEMTNYLSAICRDRADATSNVEITFEAKSEGTKRTILLDTDRAITMALAVTELVLNAAKHAYPNGGRGRIWVCLREHNDQIAVSVRDEGRGLPPDYDGAHQGAGFGTRLVGAFVKQMRGQLRVNRLQRGTEFVIEIPRSLQALGGTSS